MRRAKPVGDAPEKAQLHAKRKLQKHLLAWFSINRRDFPWRNTRDPYAILIAEKLLQQTAATDLVVKAYQTLNSRYPTPQMLSQAEPHILKETLSPLGFHYRAQELVKLATVLVNDFNGTVPTDIYLLKSLPGVGEYIARAILSFAHNHDVAIVDTNVARFLYRIHGIEKPLPANPARSKEIIALATELIPHTRSRDFNFAVLDLCAKICLPRKPKCTACPVQLYCQYGSSQVQPETDDSNTPDNKGRRTIK